MLRKGQKLKYDKTGEVVTVVDRGHYPDTIIVDLNGQRMEVYLRHLTILESMK